MVNQDSTVKIHLSIQYDPFMYIHLIVVLNIKDTKDRFSYKTI